ncbi:MAG TPA: NmrA family NAD(P)-binding protein [Flavitalea sp.]|nr:NmrA family NAD(P)-binding protein [Flavitalea sp.]
MKYVLTGSTGHITKPVTIKLVEAGHDVSVITSSEAKRQEIESLGAKALVGTIEDRDFLTNSFSGADVVYTMVPPKWDPTDWKAYIGSIGTNYAAAIKTAGVKKVVNLSSVGADQDSGCGPVTGLHHVENELNALAGVDVKHLRPGYFYDNLLSNIGMIKGMNLMGSNMKANAVLPVADTNDIAEVAASFLLHPTFTGKSFEYVISDVVTPGSITSLIGKEIGKPELPWVEFTDEQSIGGMQQAGLSEEVARNYTEMGAAIRSGKMMSHFISVGKPVIGKVKAEEFAKRFASIYRAS